MTPLPLQPFQTALAGLRASRSWRARLSIGITSVATVLGGATGTARHASQTGVKASLTRLGMHAALLARALPSTY